MFISDFAIQRPIVTITAMVAIVVFGLAALINLQTDEFPDIQQPVVSVTIPYPGASPEVVEREIVEPVEEAVFAISGLDGELTTSSSIDGMALFTIFFDFEKDVQEASQDVRDAISGIRGDLPLEMEEPIIQRFDPAEEPIVSLTLSSETLQFRSIQLRSGPMLPRLRR